MSDYRAPRPAGIPTECENCAAPLDRHNITGLCTECKLIARNARLSGRSEHGEPVSLAQALENVAAILGGHEITQPEKGKPDD
jgi:hypothetical protein